ncbi:MAG: helix-turn-helix domain-containing protein [Faecousia sp.]
MPITYKVEILAALRDAGYTQNRIRNEKLIGQSYLTQLRHGELVSWKTIETICSLLQCQPGDILEYSESGETK